MHHYLTENNLAVYPIPNGNALNVFTTETIKEIRIMSMSGDVLIHKNGIFHQQSEINIATLASSTYIIEVCFTNKKIGRSIFVKV